MGYWLGSNSDTGERVRAALANGVADDSASELLQVLVLRQSSIRQSWNETLDTVFGHQLDRETDRLPIPADNGQTAVFYEEEFGDCE